MMLDKRLTNRPGRCSRDVGLVGTRVIMTDGRSHSDHGVTGRLRQVSPSRYMHLSLPFRVSSPFDRSPNTAQFLRETGW